MRGGDRQISVSDLAEKYMVDLIFATRFPDRYGEQLEQMASDRRQPAWPSRSTAAPACAPGWTAANSSRPTMCRQSCTIACATG